MKKKIWFYLLLLLTFFLILGGFQYKYKENKITKEQKLITENYNKHYSMLVSYTNRINEKEEGISLELENNIANSTDPLSTGTYKNALSYYYLIAGDYDTHRRLAIESIDEYYKSPYGKPLILSTYNYIISNSLTRKDYSFALKCSYNAIDIFNEMDYTFISDTFEKEILITLDCNIINIFINNNLGPKAVKYYERINSIDETDETYIKNERLIVFTKLIYLNAIEEYDTALKYAYKYHELAVKENSPSVEGMRINIAIALLKNGMADEALPHIIAAEGYFNTRTNKLALGTVYKTYGDYHVQKGNYQTAFNYFKDSYELYKGNSNYITNEISSLERLIQTSIDGNLTINIDWYIKEYIDKNVHLYSNDGPANLFITMKEINEKAYESKLILQEKEQATLVYASKLRAIVIIFLVFALVIFIILTLILLKEIRARKGYEDRLKELVNTDSLTKCHSRSYGLKILNALIKENKIFTLAILDIDDFKHINDTYGHMIGDEALKLLGNFLRTNLIGKGVSIRYGGEEFIIIFEGIDINEAYNLLEGLRAEFSLLTFGNNLSCTLSIGAKEWNGDILTKFLSDVDSLLYQAKNSGKNKVVIMK